MDLFEDTAVTDPNADGQTVGRECYPRRPPEAV